MIHQTLKTRRWLWPLLGLVCLAMAVGLPRSEAQVFKTVQSQQQLYASPSYSAEVVGTVPAGAEVTILQESGEWSQVAYGQQQGWLPPLAFAGAKKKLDLGKLLQGKAVQESKTDEVALAGKGFTPEVEADFRRQHPNLKYDQVDRIEGFTVSAAELQAFRQEGGLR